MTGARDIAKGRWKEILPALGVDAKFLQNRHGPCPICGGEDRFRWDDQHGEGGFVCNSCGAGDGFRLAGRVTGQTFKQLADKVEEMLGHSNNYRGPMGDVEEMRQRQKMKTVWEASVSPKLGGPAAIYLQDRVGCLWPSQAIREGIYGQHSVMVCKIVDHAGERAVNLHLTMLTDDGQKANLDVAKRVMKGKLPDGCAIRLGPEKAVMGVAEGIETAISAAIMFDMPVWACINGTLLSKWIPPAMAEQITVFGDNDANYTGQSKAYHLANRLEVQYKRRVTVMIPPVPGEDWNDFWHEGYGKGNLPKTHAVKLPGFLRIVK
jgi:putative DNA primase/helicase